MLKSDAELNCGVFDSAILRKNQHRTQARAVTQYELEIFHTETGKSYIDDECRPVRRGMVLCATPGMVRQSDLPVRCSFIRISPEAAAREGLIPFLSALPTFTYLEHPEEIDALIAAFTKLAQRLLEASSDNTAEIRANAHLFELLYRLHRICTQQTEPFLGKPADNVLYAAREYLNEHYTEGCSLQEVARAVNLSPNYLHTIFHQAFGETPHAYVMRRRTEQAKRLIMTGQHSMLEIALVCGFCTQSHFNKVFKAQTGMTPKQFRDAFLQKY